MKYFTVEELCKSDTAKKLKIANNPTPEIEVNLNILIHTLDDIREKWGSGIRVNSGYRCEKLNKAVGGVSHSAHRFGFAADLYPVNEDYEGFVQFIIKWAETASFDQIIQEKSGSAKWIHFGLYNRSGEQRKMIFDMVK